MEAIVLMKTSSSDDMSALLKKRACVTLAKIETAGDEAIVSVHLHCTTCCAMK